MSTLKARYTSLKTLTNNYFDFEDFEQYMNEMDKTIRLNKSEDCIEIVEIETAEVVDYAHPIIISHKGQKFYDVYLSEMESSWDLDGDNFSTICDDIEFSNYPTMIRRALRK